VVALRDACEADWPAIWRFMQPIVAAGETFSWDRDTTEAAARDGWFHPPPGATLVAVDEATGRVIGTASVHRNHGGPAAHVASASFFVDPAHTGRGAGRALGEGAIARARREGFRAMQFNAVVEANARAVALWRSLGFEILGTVPEGFLHPTLGFVGLHIMYRSLLDEAARGG
jgi:L-amino acid N-acyltransferase YncA